MKFRLCSILLGLAMLISAGCGGGTTSTPQFAQSSQVHDFSRLASSGGAVPTPASGDYFGAWVSPDGPSPSEPQQRDETKTLESQIGRIIDTHMHYYGWTAALDPNTGIANDVSIVDKTEGDLYVQNIGRIPVISWGCPSIGGKQGGLDAINNGTYDSSVIVPVAQAIKSLGKPVFLRFFWEFNENTKGGTANGNDCFTSSEIAGGYATEGSVFVQAWQRIWRIFHQNGATNVAWLWNPAAKPNNTGGSFDGTFGSTKMTMTELAYFFPTNCSYNGAMAPCVDWVGNDAYDKDNYLANPLKNYSDGFESLFGPFYNGAQLNVHMAGIPFAIAETGETPCNDPSSSVSAQNEYLHEARTDLEGGAYPLIKTFMYFDEEGAAPTPPPCATHTHWDWQLLPSATPKPNGFDAWKTMSGDAFFNTR